VQQIQHAVDDQKEKLMLLFSAEQWIRRDVWQGEVRHICLDKRPISKTVQATC